MNNNYIALLLLGFYSGILATVPIGPSKILAVRNFLIRTQGSLSTNSFNINVANSSFIAALTGILVGQIYIILSIYFPALYSLWMKPHLFSIIFLPFLLYLWSKIKILDIDKYNNNNVNDSHTNIIFIQTAFLESLFLQLLNPIIFPNAVFSRLSGVFLFRYSQIFFFLFGILSGLLSGYLMFFICTETLLKRLEKDTPIIYRLVKRIIHQVFFSLFFIICLISLGRTPIVPIQNLHKESWKEKGWPDIFFSYDTWTRPMRLLKNNKTNLSDENMRAFNKMYFSQYFFESQKNNGNIEFFLDFPESLSIVSKEINNLLKLNLIDKENNQESTNCWIENKNNRKAQILQTISNRLLEFNKKKLLDDIVDKKIGSANQNGIFINKSYDPRLNIGIASKELEFYNKSPLLVNTQDFVEKRPFAQPEKTNFLQTKTNNRLKLFLSKNYIKFKILPIVNWESHVKENNLNIENKHLSIKKSNVLSQKTTWFSKTLNQPILKNIFDNIEESLNLNQEKKSNINDFLEDEQTNLINSKNLLNFYTKLPLWNSKITRTDLQTPEPNEFRSILANFVRNLLPGAIRARRRKALTWNIYQNQAHSPIFLRAMDVFKNIKNLTTNPESDIILMNQSKNEIQNNANILKTRWNFTIAHFVRGIALCTQAYMRRYIKIPVFIILKNITRQILLLPTEWQEDWKDLSQEIYVDCDYDGNDLYVGIKFPNILELTGKQIKILRPFTFKYSKHLLFEHKPSNTILEKNKLNRNQLSNYTLDNYSYLTIWGIETNEPFGKTKDSYFLWKPILKRIQLIIHYKVYNKVGKFFAHFTSLSNTLYKLVQQINNLHQSLYNVFDKQEKNDSHSQINTDQNAFPEKKLYSPTQNTSQTKYINKELNTQNPRELDERKVHKLTRNIHSLSKKQKIQTITNKQNIEKIKDKQRKEILLNHFVNTNVKNKTIRKYNLKHIYILFQKTLFNLYRSLYKIRNNLSLNLKKYSIQFTRKFSQNYLKLKGFYENLKFGIYRYFNLFNGYLSRQIKTIVFETQNLGTYTKDQYSPIQNEQFSLLDESLEKRYLSQAGILHSILDDSLINTNSITELIHNWEHKKIINTKGKQIVQNSLNKNIQIFPHIDFQTLIEQSEGYVPSVKIWQHFVPHIWTESVQIYWEKFPERIYKYETLEKDFLLENKDAGNYLSYHTPLFGKAEKFFKTSQINTLLKQYSDFHQKNSGNIFNINQSNTFTQNKNIDLLSVNKNITKEETIFSNENSIQLASKLSGKNTIKDKPYKFTKIQNELIKQLPLLDKEIKRITSNIPVYSVKNRISYPPTRENKWKFTELQNRFRNLMRVAKQRNVLKESLLDKKQNLEIPYEMRKDLSMFYKTYQPEDILFVNLLENWRYKIIDDELLMHETISSYLKFLTKKQNNWKIDTNHFIESDILDQQTTNQIALLPEILLLPNNLRELRILEHLNLTQTSDQHTKPNKSPFVQHSKNQTSLQIWENQNSQTKKITQYINRNEIGKIITFLWPTHRLEDLAFVNRFWFSNSNQSRFSLLRIRSYPLY